MALYDPAPLTPAEQVFCEVECNPAASAEGLGVTVWQVQNLLRLARYLRGLPADYAQFEMLYFASITDGEFETQPDEAYDVTGSCGTVACAVGHGPAAGIANLPSEAWEDYGLRVFGVGWLASGEDNLGRCLRFDVLFSPYWHQIDNTPRGAAARILHCLQNPEPESLSSFYSMTDASAYAHLLA